MIENSTLSAEQQPENSENNSLNPALEVESNENSSDATGNENLEPTKLQEEPKVTAEEVGSDSENQDIKPIEEINNSAENDTPVFETTQQSVAEMEQSTLNPIEDADLLPVESNSEEPVSEINVPANSLTAESTNTSVSEQPESPTLEGFGSEKNSTSEETLEAEHAEVEIQLVGEHELAEMEKEDEESEIGDFSDLDKEQLVKIVEQLNRDVDPNLAHRSVQKIKPLFDAAYQKDLLEAKEKYEAEGGDPTTFEYKFSGLEHRFQQALKGINEKRKQNQDFQTKERARNLEAKLLLLEQLRQLADDHEHNPGFERFKEIKEEWKKIGPVGAEHAKNLNDSYYILNRRFFDLGEQYHILKDFDRKKNLEHKIELIAKIEKLADEEKISKAMKDLMSYMEEYRSLGPVPKDNFDEIKNRLKTAVDILYNRRKAFNEERKNWLAEETALKEELIQKVLEFETFASQQVKDWQTKTKELLAIQEEWKKAPNRFREKTGEMNKQFWNIFKKFMSNKNEFFKTLDKGKKEVLAQKQALVEEVNGLKDGEDFDGIANRMKELQQEWKKIAPVFGKEGQKVYDDFKSGIDHFFGRLRDQRSGEEKVQSENLILKEQICTEIEALAASGTGTKQAVDELKEKFKQVGFVPMKSIQKINGRFSKAMMDLIESSKSIPSNEKEKMKISLLSNRSTYSSEGVKTLKNQEGYIQKRLQQLRKDVGNLEDNMSMFKMSKNAMAIIEDYQKRINLSRLEIKELESQLKEIRQGE